MLTAQCQLCGLPQLARSPPALGCLSLSQQVLLGLAGLIGAPTGQSLLLALRLLVCTWCRGERGRPSSSSVAGSGLWSALGLGKEKGELQGCGVLFIDCGNTRSCCQSISKAMSCCLPDMG